MLDKIRKVASNDLTAFAGIEQDIQVEKNENDDVIIDILAHYIVPDENEGDRMIMRYATCKSLIKDPNLDEYRDKTQTLLHRIVFNTIRGFTVPPNANLTKQQMQSSLETQGMDRLEAALAEM